ncbi:MAG: 1-acyl-sn-glycerol-3-phosphate acyltransferase [Anaerolineae bacterium]|nr:1-acyl-sn-glycerol-3-phosphate acyltransferase [Anaerolineae bacterium]
MSEPSLDASVQAFVARQPGLAWRRRWLCAFIRFWMRILGRMTITGMEHVPPSGPTLIIMNHATYLDPVVVMGAMNERFVVPMSKAENTRSPIVGPFIWWYGAYTVNRGVVDRQALMTSIELIKAGQMIAISPEGTRHPEGLSRPKDGVVYVASKSDAVMVPVAVSGLQNWQKTIPTLRRPKVQVNFGQPFRLKLDGRTRIPRDELSAMSEELMYQLSRAVADPALRGEYADLSKTTTELIEFVDPRTGEPLPAAPAVHSEAAGGD